MEQKKIVSTEKYPVLTQIIVLLLLTFGFLTAVGGVLSWLIIFLCKGGDTSFYFDLLKGSTEFKSDNIYYLYITQGCMAFSGFILLPIIWNKWVWKKPLLAFIGDRKVLFSKDIFWLFIAFVSFLLVLIPITHWNEQIQLPEQFSSLEESFKVLEANAKEQVELFTSFVSLEQFLIATIIMVILPAVGEEFLFRGIFQPLFSKIANNHHIGIFITAFLFSAFHLQFYGFFPRFLFGIFFGYIVHFKGSLWPAIFCHFINNGLTITLIYIYQLKWTSENLTTSMDIYWLETIVFFFSFLFFTYFYVFLSKNRING